jgi:hypothetical protein
MDQLVPFTPKAKERAATAVLRAWQRESDGIAERFIHRLGNLVVGLHNKTVDALDVHHIEAWTEKTERELNSGGSRRTSDAKNNIEPKPACSARFPFAAGVAAIG